MKVPAVSPSADFAGPCSLSRLLSCHTLHAALHAHHHALLLQAGVKAQGVLPLADLCLPQRLLIDDVTKLQWKVVTPCFS